MGTRWECPNEKHPAVLAPTKPRKDDVRRYCLPCSEASGRLAPRVARALEAKRTAAVERRQARRTKGIAIERAKVDAYYTVDGVDMREELAIIWRLPVVAEWLARRHCVRVSPRRFAPALHIRRQRAIRRLLGWASYGRHLIRLMVTPTSTATQVIGTLLHEVVHIALGKVPGAPHGRTFKATLRTLTDEYDALGRREKMPPDTAEDGGSV